MNAIRTFLVSLWLTLYTFVDRATASIVSAAARVWNSAPVMEIRGALQAKWVGVYAKVSAVMLASLVAIQTASAQSLTIDLDISQLFDQINNFLPVGIAIFAVPVGIVVAFTLIRFVANALIKAFNGQQL